jgi:hypothetical protein
VLLEAEMNLYICYVILNYLFFLMKLLLLLKYKILHIFIITTNMENIMEHSIINKILPKYLITRCYFRYIVNPINYNILWPRYKLKKSKKMAKYVLIDIKAPEIILGVRAKDPEVGGIKLIYSKSKEYSLTAESKTCIFLKPYKELWEPKRKKFCKKNEWGNTRSPFSNVWIELYEDYINYDEYIKKNGFMFNEKVIDSKLIKNLNRKSQTFYIDEFDDKPTTHLSEKILFWINEYIFNPIKERIFINN